MFDKFKKTKWLEEEPNYNSSDDDKTEGFIKLVQKGALGLAFMKVVDFLGVFLIALAIVIPVRYFLAQPFRVKGSSMEPNFQEGEYLIINELGFRGYRFSEAERGEVIIFKSPVSSDYYIKRVIGLPGEKVKIEKGKVFIFNKENPKGIVLKEQYLEDSVKTNSRNPAFKEVTLKKDQYFVLGDNREESSDSRYFGPIDQSRIIGKTWIRAFPFERFKVF